MLTHIHISHFALVDQLEVSFSSQMSALTGETGAGKSIIVDALGFALGDRADSMFVRHGQDKATISVSFNISDRPAIASWLESRDLDADDECQIRRIIAREGPSRGYINGNPVPMQLLRELGEQLVDIHGQHEHQSLLKVDAQRDLLDAFGGHEAERGEVTLLYRRWRQARKSLDELSGDARSHETRVELLGYQLDELHSLALADGELQALDKEHDRLANASHLMESGQQLVHGLLEADVAVVTTLERYVAQLNDLAEHDDGFGKVAVTLNDAAIAALEAAKDLRQRVDGLEQDPARLSEVEQRLVLIHDLARKHHVAAKELPEITRHLEQQLADLLNAEGRVQQLRQEIEQSERQYKEISATLTKKRLKAAKTLSASVTDNMQQLGMSGGRFEIRIGENDNDTMTAAGVDRIEFVVSANPGQPLKPLNKVASGGELSRISLAIQVISAASVQVPTLIFDEVDVGIGGGVAEIVGRQLRRLSDNAQILCVTHLPQVASQAQTHYVVSKQADAEETTTMISMLDEPQRQQEIARMLGGVEITEQTLVHAAEMIQLGQKQRKHKKAG
ncbi:MAG: DNA repair protein RecN [Gammaproteobacteria bacterium]|nr:MAG: DNA repair protein RecN [Gammaproteobacteria bacterium]